MFFSCFQKESPDGTENRGWVTTNDDLIFTLRSETFKEKGTKTVVVSVRLMVGSTVFWVGTYFGNKMLVQFMQRKPRVMTCLIA